jgi:acyl carrier protein
MIDQKAATMPTEAQMKGELRIRLLKDEIAAQANTFDQIDSKTGVALGFTFVVVGQILASVFRIATDQSRLQSSHPCLTTTAFLVANCLAIAAIICGIVARWPRCFQHSLEFSEQDLDGSYEDLLETMIDGFSRATVENESTNSSKSDWAVATYLLVGGALVGYLCLTIMLYTWSIPNSNRGSASVAAVVQLSPARSLRPAKEEVLEIKGENPTAVKPEIPLARHGGSKQRTGTNEESAPTPDAHSEIERRVKAIIVEQLQVEESKVTANASFNRDLGADDLDVVELALQFEEAFDLEIPDEDLKGLATVKDAVSYVEKHSARRTRN